MNLSANSNNDDWSLYDGIWGNGHPILLRFRNGLESYIGSQEYPLRYMITWSFEDFEEGGYPSTKEIDAVEDFENLIYDKLQEGNQCICVAVITNNGEREWIFYSSDTEETHHRLNLALENSPVYPISIVTCPDPGWEEYNGMLMNIENMSK